MKKIIVAKNAGFCFGVKLAIQSIDDNIEKYDQLYTYGDIIHNKDVVNSLAKKGVKAIEDINELSNTNLVIRSHGAPPQIYEYCKNNNINVIDSTCPFVKHIHKLVSKGTDMTIIILGESVHPEVIGIKGWAGKECYIVNDLSSAKQLPNIKNGLLVCQTTFEITKFNEILPIVQQKVEELLVENTICNTTMDRQIEAQAIAKRCDCVVVIGSIHSSNTTKLYNICKKYCKSVHLIENASKLPLEITDSSDIIGVLAGASTPDWIIREVITTMSENTNITIENGDSCCQEDTCNCDVTKTETTTEAVTTEQIVEDNSSFLEDLEKSLVRIQTNQIVQGTVVQIKNDEVYVNIGYKSDGIIPKSEFSDDTSVIPSEVVKVGDVIEAQVLKLNDGEGNVLLSQKRIESRKAWTDFEEKAKDENAIFSATGKEAVKGGLISIVDGLKVFIPASLIDTKFVKDLTVFVGQTFDVKIIEVDKAKRKIVANRKILVEEINKKEKSELWSKFAPKEEIEGTVKRLTDFGAFVDIGGIDGLLHIADIAWFRIKHPSDILKVNDKIKVVILSVNPEKERISLGLKQLQPRPWELAPVKYPVGAVVEGKVVRILDFGAFVELEPGIDGLVHISQVATKRIEKITDELTVGDVIKCKVIAMDAEAKKISLSRREVLFDEMPPEERQEQQAYKSKNNNHTNNNDDTYVPEIQDSSVSIAEFFPQSFLDELNDN